VPPGWRLEADRSGPDARLLPPGPATGEQVLIHPWTSARELTPAEAAVEYQATLPTPRDASAPTPLEGASGSPGVVVVGNWPLGGPAPPLTVFVAYAAGTHCLALALCCPPERIAAARLEYFDTLAGGVYLPGTPGETPPALPVVHPPAAPPAPAPVAQPPVTPPAAPPVAPPVAPSAPPPATSPQVPSPFTPQASPVAMPAVAPPAPAPATTTPVVPPAPPPVVAPAVTPPPVPGPVAPPVKPVPPPPPAPVFVPPAKEISLGGFTLPDNTGWRASVSHGTLWVVDPGGASGYCLWPVRAPEGLDPEDLLAAWARDNQVEMNLIARREAGGGTLITATLGADGQQRALFFLSGEGPVALLVGLYTPAAEWGRQAPRLAGWLAQVQSAGWRRTLPPLTVPTQAWTDPGQSLALQLPAGWTAMGGEVGPPNAGQVAISLTASGEDCQFSWQEPCVPAFRELTPILESLGEAEGNPFRESEDEDYLRILNRRTPAEFVTYLLSQPDSGLPDGQVQSAEASEALATMLPGADHQGAVVRVAGTRNGQPRERIYLVATAALPLREGAFRWQGAYCYLDYPAGQFPQAFALLRVLLGSARPAQPHGDAVLAGYIEPVAQGLKSISLPEAPPAGPVTLLGEGYEAAGDDPAQFTAAGALESWRGLVQPPASLPELSGNG